MFGSPQPETPAAPNADLLGPIIDTLSQCELSPFQQQLLQRLSVVARRLTIQQQTTLVELFGLVMMRPDDMTTYQRRQIDTTHEWLADSLNDLRTRMKRLAHANNQPCGESCYGNDCTLP